MDLIREEVSKLRKVNEQLTEEIKNLKRRLLNSTLIKKARSLKDPSTATAPILEPQPSPSKVSAPEKEPAQKKPIQEKSSFPGKKPDQQKNCSLCDIFQNELLYDFDYEPEKMNTICAKCWKERRGLGHIK